MNIFAHETKFQKKSHIYVQFSNLVFDLLSSNNEKMFKMFILIENYDIYFFVVFMNDHDVSVTNFETLFSFFYVEYFFRIVFESVYLSNHKTYLFTNILKMFNFQSNVIDLRSFVKHRNKIKYWFISMNRKKFNVFLWLIFFCAYSFLNEQNMFLS